MNRTKEQHRKAVFGKFQAIRRKLQAKGVPCTYARSVLSHTSGDISFKIICKLADDGATLEPQITVRTAEGTQTFDHLTFDQGLARLKELFQAHHAGNGQAFSSDTQHRTEGQASNSNGDPQDGSNHVPNPVI